ncbi:MAG: hypothetical protein IJA73_02025, partial [Oscillospiraceae bacterium]|nr:hypothetical protein [Oscillospiraceae bacterium]
IENDGLYRVFRAKCTLVTDRICRLTLCGTEGEFPLGVLAPFDGALCLTRRISAASVRGIGDIVSVRAEMGRAIETREETWQALGARRPFTGDELSSLLSAFDGALFREEGDRVCIALPFSKERPFPLEPLFCFASVRTVEGEQCAVFTVDRAGEPIFEEN